jgi:competence ComEA-like helix-hairpin-helix protein
LTSILFITSNGVGMGHLTRAMAIARRLPEGLTPIVLTMSKGLPIAREQGFYCEYFPSSQVSGLDNPKWSTGLAARVSGLIQEHKPAVVAFDGVSPYSGVRRALAAHPETISVWIRRAMWRAGTPARQLEPGDSFDLVLEPGEFAAAADEGPTVAVRDEAFTVSPIVFCDESDLLPRAQAEAELGLDPNRLHALIQIGEVPQPDRDILLQTCANYILERPGIQVAVLESAISEDLVLPASVVKLAAVYPIARLYRAFDFVISAAGYNSYHELIGFKVPAAFFPAPKPTDDQQARVRYAEGAGVGVEVDLEPTRAVDALLDEAERVAMTQRAEEMTFGNGAQEAADEIARLASAPDPADQAARNGRLSLKTVTAEQLSEIDGIGPATAYRLIEYRDRVGEPLSLDDLSDVQGIGPATLESLRTRLGP